MELLAIVISVASLLTNVVIVRRFTGSLKAETHTIEFEPLPAIETVCQCANHKTEISVEPEPVRPEPKVEASSSPWQNKTNIPWNESIKPSPQPAAPTVNAPLERPYGFS